DKEGYANAEKYVIDNLDKIIKQNNKELFIITTFASNIERLQGIVEIAKKYKKRIVILGKSLFYSFNFMKKNNLIDYDNIYINTDNIKVTCTENDIVIVTGNQGENNSGLTRINELLYVPKKIRKNIIFSSSIIPGNEVKIRELKIQLLKKGYNIIDDNIYHVSGHMSKNELNMLIKYLKPHFYIPIH
ncbi:MAG: hypothetical protein N2202_10380, partial [Proteobacteria bacterium]|nr:hypothetical protein [Pseudomonadota bacterium]